MVGQLTLEIIASYHLYTYEQSLEISLMIAVLMTTVGYRTMGR